MSAVASRSLVEDLTSLKSIMFGLDQDIPLMELAMRPDPRWGAPAGIKKHVLAGMDVDIEDSYGNTALVRAVYFRAEANVAALLEMRADPNKGHLLPRLLLWRLPFAHYLDMEPDINDPLGCNMFPPHEEAEKIRRIATLLVKAGALIEPKQVAEFLTYNQKLEAVVMRAREQQAEDNASRKVLHDQMLRKSFVELTKEYEHTLNPYIGINNHTFPDDDIPLVNAHVAVNRFAGKELLRLQAVAQAKQRHVIVISQ